MQVAIRPMEASLTHDTEFIARMVLLLSLRIPIVKSIWVDRCNVHLPARVEEKLLTGTMCSTSLLWVIPCFGLKFGITMLSKMISLVRAVTILCLILIIVLTPPFGSTYITMEEVQENSVWDFNSTQILIWELV